MPSLYDLKIENLKSVGKVRAELFHKLNIHTVGELIRYYPSSYVDLTKPVTVADTVAGSLCCLKAELVGDVIETKTLSGMLVTGCRVADETGYLKIVFFNNKYIKEKLLRDKTFCFYGRITEENEIKQMTAPELYLPSDAGRLYPVYHLTAGLTNKIVSNSVKAALKMLPPVIKDTIPDNIRQKYGLCDLKTALFDIHFPKNRDDYEAAHYRLIFEEMLILNLGLSMYKIEEKNSFSPKISKNYCDEYFDLLPFKPTNAQIKAADECFADMSGGNYAMSRLLQGDVGCGKTAVASALSYTAVKNGGQVAFMAPTEILAEQHYNNLSKIMNPKGIRLALLKGSLKKKEKEQIYAEIENGNIDIVIGTHAIISDSVVFKNLTFAVTDEQHRFGVRQRTKLINKGKNPHLLVMSATPIPRTLGLIIYGDLDITVIDEMPSSRKKVKTLQINSSKRIKAYNFIKNEIDSGRQCYIICPAVDENGLKLASVEEYYKNFVENFFVNYNVKIIHGKLKSKEKEQIMLDFKNGKIDILLATTVVEVGIDVPNATVIMIENAERFGLSQLHQLRGRVGRGSFQSYCILLSDSKNSETRFRLDTMCSTANGFDIADADLKLRGPGDFFGSRQHGLPKISGVSLSDVDIIEKAKSASEQIIKSGTGLFSPEFKPLIAEIRRIFKKCDERLN